MEHRHNGATHCDACYAEHQQMVKQMGEIHAFLSGIATALKSPMLAAMLPPQMRDMLK